MLHTHNQFTRSFWYSAVVLVMAVVGLWWGAQINITAASSAVSDDTNSIGATAPTVTGNTTAPTVFDNRLDYFANNLSDWAVVRAAGASSPITWSILKNENPAPAGPGAATISQFDFGDNSLDFITAFGNYTGGSTSGDDAEIWRDVNTPAVYFSRPISGAVTNFGWGISGDIVGAEGDYDGDKVMDPTVVRGTSGAATWYIYNTANATFTSFSFGDIANDGFLPGADYNGDGKDDPTVFRTATNGTITWYTYNISTVSQISAVNWGNFNTDYVIPGGDYDGDGKADFAVWRGFTGTAADRGNWYIRTNTGNVIVTNFGAASATSATRDVACRHGDYDGDGKTDIAVYRRSNATFYFLGSATNNSVRAQGWGVVNTDTPVASLGTF